MIFKIFESVLDSLMPQLEATAVYPNSHQCEFQQGLSSLDTSFVLQETINHYRWHCTNSSDCQVRVLGAPSNCYGVNVTKVVIGAYTCADTSTLCIQWLLLSDELLHSDICHLLIYGVGVNISMTFCVNLTVVTVNVL